MRCEAEKKRGQQYVVHDIRERQKSRRCVFVERGARTREVCVGRAAATDEPPHVRSSTHVVLWRVCGAALRPARSDVRATARSHQLPSFSANRFFGLKRFITHSFSRPTTARESSHDHSAHILYFSQKVSRRKARRERVDFKTRRDVASAASARSGDRKSIERRRSPPLYPRTPSVPCPEVS